MNWSEFSGRGRSVAIVLCALGALAISPAVRAEDSAAPADTAAPADDASGAVPSGHGIKEPVKSPFTVTIPTIQTDGSSIDEATLRSIIAGDLADHADELASLSATSIKIPEIQVAYEFPEIEGQPTTGSVTIHDIELSGISNGVAAKLAIGGSETMASTGATVKFGKSSADNFDIGGLLAFYGLVKTDAGGDRRAIYTNLVMDGGSIAAPDANCTIGPMSVASFKARPLTVSFMELLNLAQNMSKEEEPSPADMTKIIEFYADVLDAMEISPIKFGGFNCSGTTKEGKPVTATLGGMTIGVFARGRYPEVSARDLKIAQDDGSISLGEFRFKGVDLSGPIAALKAAEGTIDDTWAKDHYRDLIPTFDGVSFSDLKVDVPDDQNPGQRIKANIGDFDISLGDYINGIPTDISSFASHIVFDLPTSSDDETIQRMIDLGIHSADVSYDVGLKWDAASNEIRLKRLSLTGDKMGAVAVSSVIGNAGRGLFSSDLSEALGSLLGLTLKRVDVRVKDGGLGDVLLASAAKEAHKEVADFRKAIADMVQGTALVFLGGVANAGEISKALGDFLNGAGKQLSITATANAADGLTFDEMNAAQDDPASLAGKVTIDAFAR